MLDSLPRRLLAATIAPALTILGMGVVNVVDAGDKVCCPPPVCEPCPPLSLTVPPTTATQDTGAPVDEIAPAPPTTFEPQLPSVDPASVFATNFGRGGASSLAFADAIAAPGYIESAVIRTRFRLRYDNAQGANAATRGGFLYPTPGTVDSGFPWGGRGPNFYSPPNNFQNDVDLEEVSAYFELAFNDCFSIFIDVPYRGIFVPNSSTDEFSSGDFEADDFSDLRVGMRLGLLVCPDQHLTLQVRTWVPTGDARLGVGTGNTSMDIGLIYDRMLTRNVTFYAELNDWQTLDAVTLQNTGSLDPSLLNQDANILRYGAGLGFDLIECGSTCNRKQLTFLAECVGWTVLDGVTAPIGGFPEPLIDAVGDTIVNGKYGFRFTCGKSSIYTGYGHNWTTDRWYSHLFRVEYQRYF